LACKRPRYYVNANFTIDYADGVPEAVRFARGRQGCFATSNLLLVELRASRRPRVLLDALQELGVRVYRVPVLRLLREAVAVLRSMGVARPGLNTVFDTAHILATRRLSRYGVKYFVTSDRAAYQRALRLKVCAVNYRTGEEDCPREK